MGSPEPGKIANMTVCAVDFLHDDMDDVAQAVVTKNVARIVYGKIVYSSEPERMSEKDAEELIEPLVTLPEIWAQIEEII